MNSAYYCCFLTVFLLNMFALAWFTISKKRKNSYFISPSGKNYIKVFNNLAALAKFANMIYDITML
jgi:hypothetical protein